jgi:predicted ATPase
MQVYKKKTDYHLGCSLWQFLLNMMGRSANPLILTGEAMNEVEFVEKVKRDNNIGALQAYWIYKGQICYYFGDIKEARRIICKFGRTKANLEMHLFSPVYFSFLDSSRWNWHRRQEKESIREQQEK